MTYAGGSLSELLRAATGASASVAAVAPKAGAGRWEVAGGAATAFGAALAAPSVPRAWVRTASCGPRVQPCAAPPRRNRARPFGRRAHCAGFCRGGAALLVLRCAEQLQKRHGGGSGRCARRNAGGVAQFDTLVWRGLAARRISVELWAGPAREFPLSTLYFGGSVGCCALCCSFVKGSFLSEGPWHARTDFCAADDITRSAVDIEKPDRGTAAENL